MNYSKKLLKHFLHPKNIGELKNPDGVGKVGNPVCGDMIWIYIKVGVSRGQEIIKNIKFKTFGCAAAIASASALTEIVKGKQIDRALRITDRDIAKELGGVPPIKFHCAHMAIEALKKAIENYRSAKHLKT